MPKFSKKFQKRILKYRRWEDAQLSILGRILLINGLRRYSVNFKDEDLSYSCYNKPFLRNVNIHFNISHSKNLVVCAISRLHEMGIDVEAIDFDICLDNFESQMTQKEWNFVVNSKEVEKTFFMYWTQKEAVIKALGKGLSIPLKSFEICTNKTVIDDEEFLVIEILLDKDYKCNLAVKSKGNRVIPSLYLVQFEYTNDFLQSILNPR